MTTHILTKYQFSHGRMTMQVYFVHPEVGHESYVTTARISNRMKDEWVYCYKFETVFVGLFTTIFFNFILLIEFNVKT